MITTINKKKLAELYKISSSTLDNYVRPHNEKIKALGLKRINKNGKVSYSQNYNSNQLKYLIEKVFGDSPEGYNFNGKTFIKQVD